MSQERGDLLFTLSRGRGGALRRRTDTPAQTGNRGLLRRAVHALMLRCQIMIEPKQRHYTPDEESLLTELFGETPRWGNTLRPFLWTNVAMTVPGFRRHDRGRPSDHLHLRLRGRSRPSTCMHCRTA